MTAAARAPEYISLLSHVESAMPSDLRIAGVMFGDARMPPLVLQYSDTGTASALLRSVTVRGHADAAAMHPQCAPIYSRVIHSLAFALVVFDWKTPTAMLIGNAAAVEAQLCSQAIAYREEFGYSVPVVATDLCTAIRVWHLEGQLLVEFLSPRGTALSLDEGMQVVWKFMRKQMRTVSAWRDAKKREPAPREDADDDGSSLGARLAPHAERGGTRAAEDRVFRWGGAGGPAAVEEVLHAEHSIYSERAKTSAITEVEADLYDDVEREAIAQPPGPRCAAS